MSEKLLWEYLNLSKNFTKDEVDAQYQLIANPTPQQREAWKLLRDPAYADIYKKTLSIDAVVKAGFFEDKLEIDELDYSLGFLCTPFGKILNYLNDNPNPINPVVLLTTGGFNPIHDGHIHMMNEAKKALEEDGYQVLGGYFSISHEDYLRTKPHYNVTKYEILYKCQKALQESNWLMVEPWESMYVQGPINFTDVVSRLQQYLAKFISPSIQVAYVCGKENIQFINCYENTGIAIGVGEIEEQSQKIQKFVNGGTIYKINTSSPTIKLSSRNFRQQYCPFPLDNTSEKKEVYIIRNEGLSSLKHLEDCLLTEKLPVYYNEFYDSIIGLLQEILPKNISVQTAFLEQQIHSIQQKIKGNETISLDSYYKGTYNLQVSRLFDVADYQAKCISISPRPGFPSLLEQISSIQKGKYILVDDDTSTGQTIDEIRKQIPEQIIIEAIHLFIDQSPNKPYEILDLRDLLIGSINSGLTIRNPKNTSMRVPYILPYVFPHFRCKIPVNQQWYFSKMVWKFNQTFYSNISKNITLSQLDQNSVQFLYLEGYNENSKILDICEDHVQLLSYSQAHRDT